MGIDEMGLIDGLEDLEGIVARLYRLRTCSFVYSTQLCRESTAFDKRRSFNGTQWRSQSFGVTDPLLARSVKPPQADGITPGSGRA
jgi:hypothetical protein